jgi:hypothetical protein
LGRRLDPAKRLTELMFDARAFQLRVAAKLGEHGLHLGLAEAQLAQGGEELRMHVDDARRPGAAVSRAIRVPEGRRTLAPAVDEQLPAMDGSMMHGAQRRKVRCLIAATLGARLDVVHIDKRGVSAAGHAATVSIASEDGAANGGWDALLRALAARAHVGVV